MNEILLYTAQELQAAIVLVAVGVALVVWLVTRWCWGRMLHDVTSKYRREVEHCNKRGDELEDANSIITDKDKQIESLNATIAQQAEDLQVAQSGLTQLVAKNKEQEVKVGRLQGDLARAAEKRV